MILYSALTCRSHFKKTLKSTFTNSDIFHHQWHLMYLGCLCYYVSSLVHCFTNLFLKNDPTIWKIIPIWKNTKDLYKERYFISPLSHSEDSPSSEFPPLLFTQTPIYMCGAKQRPSWVRQKALQTMACSYKREYNFTLVLVGEAFLPFIWTAFSNQT